MTVDPPGDFAEFAATAWPRLVRTATMLTGDFHEAEDLVQITLSKVYARWRHLAQDNVDAYVRRALVNNNLSRVRRKRVAQLLTPFLPETVHRDHADHAAEVVRRDAVLDALATLAPRQRTVLVLRYFDDLSEAEVADVLQCSIGTVKTHARRGLAALRGHPAITAESVRPTL